MYHQSSHLGDEFILSGTSPVPENLSVEVIDVLFAREWHGVRFYAGGGYLINHDPEDLDPKMTQLGLDYRSSRPLLAGKRLVGGVDIKWVEEIDWEPSTSVKFGIEFGHLRPARRGVNLMFEAYDGFSPFGQLFIQELRFYGLGLHFDF